ncbi:MAG: succinyl-CoA synthetase subunit beta [Pseudomonadota bacterium]
MIRHAAPFFAALPAVADPVAATQAFAAHCFSPFLTAARASEVLPARHDFYDLDPFSDVAPSPAKTEITEGTDRRCEVALDGEYGAAAAGVATAALAAEGITRDAPLPTTHTDTVLPGTTLLAARFLNPTRIAVVHTGTRPGPNGPETFLYVERLTPEASREAIR